MRANSQLFTKPSSPGHILLLLFNQEERIMPDKAKEEKDEDPLFDSIDRGPRPRVFVGSQHRQDGRLVWVWAGRRFFGGCAAFWRFDRGSRSLLLPWPRLCRAAISGL